TPNCSSLRCFFFLFFLLNNKILFFLLFIFLSFFFWDLNIFLMRFPYINREGNKLIVVLNKFLQLLNAKVFRCIFFKMKCDECTCYNKISMFALHGILLL